MKNYLINLRYGISFLTYNKVLFFYKKRKNIFIFKILIKNNFFFNIKNNKNFFLIKQYLNFRLSFIFGGDGSIINLFKNFFNKKIFLKCFNFGNLGFLTNNFIKKNFIKKIFIGNVLILNKYNYSLIFLNEFFIKKKSCKIFIKKKIFLSDGIIVSTNFGSTGYNFSIKNIQSISNYFIINLIFQHKNKKITFFSKKIKIKILFDNKIIIDTSLNIFLKKNSFLIINYIKKKNILLDEKISIYDK